ncbi:MAG: DUF2378 family protein [Myxococcales bacterium]|nr:DUF2378 family protein [Myxococcales bacterium]
MDFQPFDPDAPYDPKPILERTPRQHEIRGLHFNSIQKALGERASYVPFKLYSVREYNHLCLRAAENLHPRSPLCRGLWRTGKIAIEAFRSSLPGKTFMTLAAGQLLTAVRAMPKAYRLTQAQGDVKVLEAGDERVTVSMRDVWYHAPFHVGILEAGCALFGKQGDVSVREPELGQLDVRFSNLRPL